MARRIFEFVCKDGHLSDKLVDSECRATHCPICDQPAERIISTPMVKLEGVTTHKH
jgi:Zn finger protein HypA/HybF involved in hydrogenase expression